MAAGYLHRSTMGPDRPRYLLLLAAISLAACGKDTDIPLLPDVATDQFDSAVQQQLDAALDDAANHRDDARINGQLGMVLQAYDQQRAAADAYTIARHLQPDEFRWPYYHGIALTALGLETEAQQAYRAAIAVDPEFHGTHLRLARLLADSGDTQAADDIYRSLLQTHADNAQVHFEYGQFLLRSSKPEQAIPELKQSLVLAGDFDLVHYSLMQAYRRLGDREAIARHQALFEQFESVKLAISDPYWGEIQALVISDQAYLDRARMLVARGRKEAAIVELRKAEKMNPGNILVHSNLIALLGSVGQTEAAAAHFERAVEIDPLYAKAYTSYATVLNYARRYQDSLRVLREGADRLPRNSELLLEIANVYLLAQQLDAARAAYLDALEKEPGNKQALMQLGRLELQQGDADSAIAYFSQAIDPEDDATALALRALSGVSGLKADLGGSRAYLDRALVIAKRREQQDLVVKIEQDLEQLDAIAAETGTDLQ